MMRTTLRIDPKLLAEVTALTGENSKSKAIAKALEQYVRRRKIDELWAMAGRIDLDDWYEFRHGHRPEEERDENNP